MKIHGYDMNNPAPSNFQEMVDSGCEFHLYMDGRTCVGIFVIKPGEEKGLAFSTMTRTVWQLAVMEARVRQSGAPIKEIPVSQMDAATGEAFSA